MIKLKLETCWEDMINLLLEAEPQLSPQDLDFSVGQDEELVRNLANKLNRSYEHITGWIESVASSTAKA